MVAEVTMFDPNNKVVLIPSDPPVDQSSEVAALTQQVNTLTAANAALTQQVATLTTQNNGLSAKIATALVDAQKVVTDLS